MSGLELHLATASDVNVVGRLIDAMDVHYNGAGNTAGVAGAVALARQTIGSGEGTHFLIAQQDGADAGLACFAVLRPGRRHQGLIFLKDLFVVTAMRKLGVGAAMMAWLARYAIAEGIGRLDLNADHANTQAQALYQGLGGERREILMYRFDGPALWALAGRRPGGR